MPLLLVMLFVSCEGSRYIENDFKEMLSMDGEYHIDLPGGLPYFQIMGNEYVYYQAGLGSPPPIKGTIKKRQITVICSTQNTRIQNSITKSNNREPILTRSLLSSDSIQG